MAFAANDLRQLGILVCDNLRHLYKRHPWLIAGQQLVPARFRLQKLLPNLGDPHGEVDMAELGMEPEACRGPAMLQKRGRSPPTEGRLPPVVPPAAQPFDQ